jgi:hypothetical protein
MSPLALATMIVICSVVWGGFVVFGLTAVRSESRRRRES